VIQLTQGARLDMFPVWSPDGMQIAFISREVERQWVRTITLDGVESDLLQLPGDARLLAWETGGTLLYHGLDLTGAKEILRLPLAGSAADRIALTDLNSSVEFASFAPDGSQSVFAARTEDSGSQLFLTSTLCDRLEDCIITRLTDDEYNYQTPRFSPDGTLILAAANRAGNLDLYVLDLVGNIVRRLTDQPYPEYDAVWRPSQ
jgi:Tol biopolymer transport system component